MCNQKPNKQRQCVICEKQLYGRSDKRFCDITCKNYYHSEVRKSTRVVENPVLKILAKNYVILTGILGKENNTCVIDKLALERLGFRFDYVTDAVNKHGTTYFGVFELTYRMMKKRIFVTCDPGRRKVSPYIFERWSREIKETSAFPGSN